MSEYVHVWLVYIVSSPCVFAISENETWAGLDECILFYLRGVVLCQTDSPSHRFSSQSKEGCWLWWPRRQEWPQLGVRFPASSDPSGPRKPALRVIVQVVKVYLQKVVFQIGSFFQRVVCSPCVSCCLKPPASPFFFLDESLIYLPYWVKSASTNMPPSCEVHCQTMLS